MKKNKKGFTLVELIVVLLILAILIALLVPALTGYMDDAREKSALVEARQVVEATQTKASESYGQSSTLTLDTDKEDILKLAEVDGDITKWAFDTKNKLTYLEYKTNNDVTVTYCLAWENYQPPLTGLYTVNQTINYNENGSGEDGGSSQANGFALTAVSDLSDQWQAFFSSGWTQIQNGSGKYGMYKIFTSRNKSYGIAFVDNNYGLGTVKDIFKDAKVSDYEIADKSSGSTASTWDNGALSDWLSPKVDSNHPLKTITYSTNPPAITGYEEN